MRKLTLLLLAVSLGLWAACGGEPDLQPGLDAGTVVLADAGLDPADAAAEPPDAGPVPVDAGTPDAGSKAATCASEFGSALTNAFGRVDGTIHAVVGPTDTQCALPNNDHLVVQVKFNGAVHRMVVNVLSDGRNGTDTKLRYAEVPHALVGEAWSEGWHPGASLDYATTLGVHSSGGTFTPYEMNALVQRVTDRMELGAKVSVYATSSGGTRAASAHLIHRNGYNHDGAIVVDPEGPSPLFLLFHFDGNVF